MSARRYRIRTTKAEIARYWLDSAEGLARLPENCGIDYEDEPCCFACGFYAAREHGIGGWAAWNRAALDRCHLVPRQLGGDESPSNLVLLCNRCHRDAPNVGDPEYMLRWIAEREAHIPTMFALIRATIERADLRDTIDTFTSAELAEQHRWFAHLLSRWTGSHGAYTTDSTLEAVIVESVRRVVAARAESAVVRATARQDPDHGDDETVPVTKEADAPLADAQPILR